MMVSTGGPSDEEANQRGTKGDAHKFLGLLLQRPAVLLDWRATEVNHLKAIFYLGYADRKVKLDANLSSNEI